ncbi:MAG: HepT-like ribonuclease domain-containing protein, partial [Nakamurella sp.]
SPPRLSPAPLNSMQPESAAFLWDVRAAGVRITTFADGLTAASYAADELRKSAVERQLEIIGEALNRLRRADPEVAQRIPDISRIVGLRNILAHGYLVVVDVVLGSAVSERMPALLTVVENMLDEIG